MRIQDARKTSCILYTVEFSAELVKRQNLFLAFRVFLNQTYMIFTGKFSLLFPLVRVRKPTVESVDVDCALSQKKEKKHSKTLYPQVTIILKCSNVSYFLTKDPPAQEISIIYILHIIYIHIYMYIYICIYIYVFIYIYIILYM